MKIYFLRHELRDINNSSFYSPLLYNGLIGSQILQNVLNELNIDLIFSSPFKRCLQTILPFCKKNNMHVNIEYSLYEQIYNCESDIVSHDKNDFKKDLLKSDPEYFLKNENYESFFPLDDIQYGDMGHERSNKFLSYIINKYKHTEMNILFVSHQGILFNMEKRIFFNNCSLQQKQDSTPLLSLFDTPENKAALLIQKFVRKIIVMNQMKKIHDKLRIHKRKIPMGGLLLFYNNSDEWPKPINF